MVKIFIDFASLCPSLHPFPLCAAIFLIAAEGRVMQRRVSSFW